jgi:hypothetical protein
LAYIVNLLISKPLGILVLSIIFYKFSCSLGLGQPYSFSELLLWVDNLSESSKTAVITSIITISGFLIAFSINSTTQKQQLMSQMKIEASNDIEEFFNQAARNLTSANIYAKYLLEVGNHITNRSDANTIEFHLQNVIKETEKYNAVRAALQKQAVEVQRFQSKYSIIFASSWGVRKKLKIAVEAFEQVTKNIWFSTPLIRLGDPDIGANYLRHVNIEKCNQFINSYEENFDIINGSIGGLRGGLLGSITGLNLSFVINLLKMANKRL